MTRLVILCAALGAMTSTAVAEERLEKSDSEAGTFGFMVDLGVPDGVNGSLVYRPIDYIRLHVGAGHNMISTGVRAGATASLPFFISPSISLEGGRYFPGDANPVVASFGGEALDEPVLREFGYDYANAHAGFEIGFDSFQLYLHGGLSYMRIEIRNINESIEAQRDEAEVDEDFPNIEVRSNPIVTLTAPSARLGLIMYF